MTSIDPNISLGDLVTRRPHLASSFDALGIDYCCGGKQSLADAVRADGLVLDDVLATLEDAAPADPTVDPAAAAGRGWADLGPAELVDHLEQTHHVYLSAALPRLEALATKVADVHGERHDELAEVLRLVSELRADLEPHLRKEEEILFPRIRQLAAATNRQEPPAVSLRSPISVMFLEHDRAGGLLAALHATTGGYRVPADGCASYQALYAGLAELEADTHLHVHKENNLLFPAVLEAEAALGV
jgi:regulator of cell morphogenesis and NO signaling